MPCGRRERQRGRFLGRQRRRRRLPFSGTRRSVRLRPRPGRERLKLGRRRGRVTRESNWRQKPRSTASTLKWLSTKRLGAALALAESLASSLPLSSATPRILSFACRWLSWGLARRLLGSARRLLCSAHLLGTRDAVLDDERGERVDGRVRAAHGRDHA